MTTVKTRDPIKARASLRNAVPPSPVRRARLMAGYPVKVLAEAIDVPESTIWRIETGVIKAPRLEIRIALAKVLKVKEAVLFRQVGR